MEKFGIFLFLKLLISITLVTGQRNYVLPRKELLEPNGKYVLEWAVDWSDNTITFNITAETIGWVGFGLSNNGKMKGADIVIGGMFPHGQTYFSDMHAVGHQVPINDSSQDWTLMDCVESGSNTFLSIKRKLDTCDPHDYPVTDNRVSVIWAYGGKDDKEIKYHQGKRGRYDVYLLDSKFSPMIMRDRKTQDPEVVDMTGKNTPEDLTTWSVARKVKLPKNDTSYLCSMHKGPELAKKHHVIGWDVYFKNEESRQRVNRIVVYKCNIPRSGVSNDTDANSMFGPFIGKEQACYNLLTPTGGPMPTQLCTEYYMSWAVGGRSFFNPEHVGFPLGTEDDEYYMVQVHYDNPKEEAGVVVDLRLDFFYTGELRPNEGGFLLISHEYPGTPESFLLPPNSLNHRIYGHCSPECTRRILGPGGSIKIYGALMHTHSKGTQIRVHHFRREKELPWIVSDNNYDSRYQQIRNLRGEEREILPGDQLTVDCVFDTRRENGTTVVGGYSARQELCLTYLLYYNRIPDYNTCASEALSVENRKRFLNGASGVIFNQDKLNWVVTAPKDLRGLTIQKVSDSLVDWKKENRVELQREQTLRPHQGTCYREPFSRENPILPHSEGLSEDDFKGPVHYPLDVDAYYGPTRNCSKVNKIKKKN